MLFYEMLFSFNLKNYVDSQKSTLRTKKNICFNNSEAEIWSETDCKHLNNLHFKLVATRA